MFSAWDAALFRAIHLGLHHAALDPIMMTLTDPGRWKIPILVLTGACFLTRGARGALALVVLVATLAASDQLSSKVLKPIIKRPRPSVALADSRPLFGVRRSHSFPSTHAVNFTAAIPIMADVFPRAGAPYAVVASLVCLSRIYVGDHYPTDVIGGAVLGLGLGWLGRRAFRRLVETLARRRARHPGGLGTVPVSPVPESGAGGPSAAP